MEVFQGYGKEAIKEMGVSPDGYVQMAIQLAYRKMHGVNRPTYETITTRQFQFGRTETCRVMSEASTRWCESMCERHEEYSDKDRLGLFHKAIGGQLEYTAAARNGKGVDRHLFGLKKCVQEGEEMPAVFDDEAYSYSCKWFISSSQISSEYFNGYGWSQVVDEGFGIAYMIKDNILSFNIASKKRGSDRMRVCIKEALDDMKNMLSET